MVPWPLFLIGIVVLALVLIRVLAKPNTIGYKVSGAILDPATRVAQAAAPIVGGVVGSLVAPGVGTAIGGGIGGLASALIGTERGALHLGEQQRQVIGVKAPPNVIAEPAEKEPNQSPALIFVVVALALFLAFTLLSEKKK